MNVGLTRLILIVLGLGGSLLALPQVTHTSTTSPVAPEIIHVSNVLASSLADQALNMDKYLPDWQVALQAELLPEDSDSLEPEPMIGPNTAREYADRVTAAIIAASAATGLDPALIWAVTHIESHGRHWNSRGNVKRGGAREVGMMQVLPSWERMLKREYDVELDLFALEDNVMAGALILSRGGEDRMVILSYYNTGQRVRNTQYQRKVMRYWRSFDSHFDLAQ